MEETLDLARLRRPVRGTVTLSDRTTHDCLQTKSRHYHALKNVKTSDATEKVFAIARELVPTMTDEQAGDLTLEEANAIVSYASGGIALVEMLYPNVSSPAASTSPG